MLILNSCYILLLKRTVHTLTRPCQPIHGFPIYLGAVPSRVGGGAGRGGGVGGRGLGVWAGRGRRAEAGRGTGRERGGEGRT